MNFNLSKIKPNMGNTFFMSKTKFYNNSFKKWLDDNDIMIEHIIQHIMIENLLLLKDLLEH